MAAGLLVSLMHNADETSLAIRFVNAWVEKCDKIVIRKDSPFTRKFYEYMDQVWGRCCLQKTISENCLICSLNSDKTKILDECDIK